MLPFITVIGDREHEKDGDSVIKSLPNNKSRLLQSVISTSNRLKPIGTDFLLCDFISQRAKIDLNCLSILIAYAKCDVTNHYGDIDNSSHDKSYCFVIALL